MAFIPSGAPLWVPAAVMFMVGLGAGVFVSLVIAVVQSAVPRSETGTVTANVNLVSQFGSTTATALIGALIGFGVSGMLPATMDAATLTPALVHAADPVVQGMVASI